MGITRKPPTRRRSSSNHDLRKTLNAIVELTDVIKVAVFGTRDEITQEETPGIVDTVKKMNERLNAREKRDRFVYGGIALLCLIGAAGQVGVPTKEIGQSIAQSFWTYVSTHGTP